MLYDFGEIINFNPVQTIKALNYFKEAEQLFIQKMKELEAKHNLIQGVFDIGHPNISFTIKDYLFDKKALTVTVPTQMTLRGNGFAVEAQGSGSISAASPSSVLPLSESDKAVEYLSSFFLGKEVLSHVVLWTYNMLSPAIPATYEAYLDEDVLPLSVGSATFLLKRNEVFNRVTSMGSQSAEDSVTTKRICNNFFNDLSSQDIYCSAKTVSGSSFTMEDTSLSLSKKVSIDTQELLFSSGFRFLERSPISDVFADLHFAKSDLSNISSLYISARPIGDREDHHLISQQNNDEIMNTLFNIGDDTIGDDFKVEISGSKNAASFRSVMELCTSFLNTFYVDRLKMFLLDYSDLGPLSEMLSFLEKSIAGLNQSFVRNDECEIPLSVSDKGCDIPCDNIVLSEPNLMVAKQKLKAIVRCSLMCDTMAYTENELAPRAIPVPGGDSFVPGDGLEAIPES